MPTGTSAILDRTNRDFPDRRREPRTEPGRRVTHLRVLDRTGELRHRPGTAQRATHRTPALRAWVDELAELTQPDEIVWCDGSADEKQTA